MSLFFELLYFCFLFMFKFMQQSIYVLALLFTKEL